MPAENLTAQNVYLTNCEREKINVPNSIQP